MSGSCHIRSVEIVVKLGTMFENENERQKTKQVPIPLPRASRNFPDAKLRNEKKFDDWTSDIIQFIRYPIQMDRTESSNYSGRKC